MIKEQHPLENTLINLKDFKQELEEYIINLPSHFWQTIGECINDIEQHIKQ